MNATYRIAIICAAAGLLSCDPSEPKQTETTVAPAPKPPKKPTFGPQEAWSKETVGPIQIGQDDATVAGTLGEPKSKTPPSMQEATGEYVTRWTWDGLWAELVSENEAGPWKVAAIGLDGPRYQTQRGVRVGSTAAEVKAAYPEIVAEGEQQVYGDVYGGIAFRIEGGKVTSIFVGAQAE